MNEEIYEIMHHLEKYNGELLQRNQADKEKIQRLQKQLEIAIKALKHYQDKHLCKEALKQIDEAL